MVPFWGKRVALSFCAALGLLVLSIAQTGAEDLPVLSPAEILKQFGPAVVLIMGLRDGEQVVQGTGFVVSPDGIIVSNYHVIKGAYPAIVKLGSGDVYDQIYVSNWDVRRDIAIIKIPGYGLPTVTLGDSDLTEVGEHLVAIGNPRGLEQSIADGLLSGVREVKGTRIHQVSIPISGGSSGSPVFNDRGEVVGVAFATIEDGQNLNFSVPINYVRGLLGIDREMSLEDFAQLEEEVSLIEDEKGGKFDRSEALTIFGQGITKMFTATYLWHADVEWRTAGSKDTFWGREWKKPIIPAEGYMAQNMFHEAAMILGNELSGAPKDIRDLAEDLGRIALKADNALKVIFASAQTPDLQAWQRGWGDLRDTDAELSVLRARLDRVFEEVRSAPREVQDAFPRTVFLPAPDPKRGYLGVNLVLSSGPLVVLVVMKDGPAYKELHVRDVIVRVAGSRNFTSSVEFTEFMNSTRPGDELELVVLRDGKELTVRVVLGVYP